MTTTSLTAAEITRTLTAAGWPGFTSTLVAPGRVSVAQRYSARRALTPADTRARREQRAKLAAEVLQAHGYTAGANHDRLIVTAGTR